MHWCPLTPRQQRLTLCIANGFKPLAMELAAGRSPFLALALAVSVAPAPAPAPPEVLLPFGLVSGNSLHAGRVEEYLGLPYAAPPVGDLRFRAPVDWRAPFGRTLPAHRFGPSCTQWGGQLYNESADGVCAEQGPHSDCSEDCLTVNVWRPADAGRGTLPLVGPVCAAALHPSHWG